MATRSGGSTFNAAKSSFNPFPLGVRAIVDASRSGKPTFVSFRTGSHSGLIGLVSSELRETLTSVEGTSSPGDSKYRVHKDLQTL